MDPKLIAANSECVAIHENAPTWPHSFRREREFLRSVLPPKFTKRIEHFGSTALPNLASKPIVDMLMEIDDVSTVTETAVPVLTELGYEYFWRTTFGSIDGEPHYAWFIKHNEHGDRTHHIHMVESTFPHWDRLGFRDYLIDHPEIAEQYRQLKRELAKVHPHDRTAYTAGKSDFIANIMRAAG